jgi:amidase
MAHLDDLARQTAALDAVDQAELVRTGQVTPVELVRAAIARIELLDDASNGEPGVNAVIHRRFDRALAEAADPSLPDGPFRGVPMLLKDLWPSSAGDPLHLGNVAMKAAGYRHPTDANITRAYRRAGMVLLGRTNTPELGAVATTEPIAYGPSRNPWNLAHSTGGSSGGAAAAVASGMVPVANASDGGGSIRIPASACGLVGLKPSRGRISMGPLQDEWGVSVQHVVSTTVRDTAALLDVSAGYVPGDGVVAPVPSRPFLAEVGAPVEALRIGMMLRPVAGPSDPECEAAARGLGSWLASLGHRVEESHPAALEWWAGIDAGLVIWGVNMQANLARMGEWIGRELGQADMEPATWELVQMTREVTGLRLAQAQGAQHRLRRETAAWWESFDLLLTPTCAIQPPRLGDLVAHDGEPLRALMRSGPMAAFTGPWNATGQPAISLPVATSAAGLPVGVQLVGAYGREDLLLRVAAAVEADLRWDRKRPGVHATRR